MKWLSHASFVIVLIFVAGCGGSVSPDMALAQRSFYMGFTPWPYDATLEAYTTTYDKLNADGDMVDHQLMQGIPWEEAYNVTAYPTAVEADLNGRLSLTNPDKVIFLAIDSLNPARDGLANNWGANGEEPRSGEWVNRNFDSPEVIAAYVNFASDLIDRFQPAYFNYATEASELILKDLTTFTKFKVFAKEVYNRLKARYPDLKLLFSISLKSPGSSEMTLVKTNIADILQYVDVIGVSVYPYIFFNHADKGNPANLPANWLSQITDIAPGKPIVITETGWIAETLVLNLSNQNISITVNSNESDQKAYVTELLEESNRLGVEFVIWWSIIDFQALWNGALMQDEVAAIWRDIGLYDEQVQPRPGLSVWKSFLERERI